MDKLERAMNIKAFNGARNDYATFFCDFLQVSGLPHVVHLLGDPYILFSLSLQHVPRAVIEFNRVEKMNRTVASIVEWQMTFINFPQSQIPVIHVCSLQELFAAN